MQVAFVNAERGATLIPELPPAAQVAILARSLHREGWNEGNSGHMTFRQPDGSFLVLSGDYGWDEARPEDILRIDIDGNVVDGDGSVTPAIILHLEYHRLHHGCMWTVHQHPRFATVWAALGRIPPAYHQQGAGLGEGIGLYDDYEGNVSESRAAQAAAAAIGDHTAVLLRNHGAFVVGDDVRQVFSRAYALELRCRLAWHVEAVGPGRPMPEMAQRSIVDAVERVFAGRAPGLWEWAVRRELRADPTLLEHSSAPRWVH